MKRFHSFLIAGLLAIFIIPESSSQCKTWNGLPNLDELLGQHSVYREFVKNENFDDAFGPWEEVYTQAPAADGLRDFHYTDGIKIYKAFFAKETDEAKKKEYVEKVLNLYDEAIACYESRAIRLKCTGDELECYDTRVASLLARKGYDMYYSFRSPYSTTLATLKSSLDKGGNNTEYTVIVPYAKIAVYEFLKERLSQEETREVHDRLLELCDSNIAAKGKYAAYYEQAKANVLAEFKTIEYQIFDCAYFKEQWMPEYEEKSDDPTFARELFNRLRARGCADDDPFMSQLSEQWEVYAAEENARRQAEFEANNPGMVARKLYEEGKFEEASDKYQEAIDLEEDVERKAGYHFSKASIMFRKLNRYADARSEAYKAAKLRPDWGRPYSLIGDMYSRTANSCGDSWNQSLAVLAAYEKWSYARSLELSPDEEQAVQDKLGRYRKYFPAKEEGFMKGIKAGSKQKVGCWIGESVTIKYST